MGEQSLLIILSGPSGAGKSTVCRDLVYKSKDIVCSVSATTRLPREGEVNGESYYFLSAQEFREGIDGELFLEWAEILGNFYGTPRSFVEKILSEDKDVILEIDVQGGLQVKEKFPAAVLIFLLPPAWNSLQSRLLKRASEPLSEVEERLRRASQELKLLPRYDYAVVNDQVETAVFKIQSILVAEKCRTRRIRALGS